MWKYLNQAQLADGELWAVLKALSDIAADIFLLILETFQLFVVVRADVRLSSKKKKNAACSGKRKLRVAQTTRPCPGHHTKNHGNSSHGMQKRKSETLKWASCCHTQLSAVGCCVWLWTDSWSQLQLILTLCARRKRAKIWLPTKSDALLHMSGRYWMGGVNTWAEQYCSNVSMPFVTSQGCFYVCAFECTPSEKWSEQK